MKEPLGCGEARKLLSSILTNGQVVPTRHFRDELANDRMNMQDALNILNHGQIYEPAEQSGRGWTYRVHWDKVGTVVVAFTTEMEARLVSVWKKKR